MAYDDLRLETVGTKKHIPVRLRCVDLIVEKLFSLHLPALYDLSGPF